MKNTNTKFILGGGISGLIYAFYNKDHTIISPDLGGRLNQDFFKNIIYLHETKESEQFLKDTGVPYNKRTQLIKYSVKDKISMELTVDDKVNMIRKKLDDQSFNPVDLNLSTDDYYISILEFSYPDVIEKLKSQIQYIEDKVIKITRTELITENTRYQYDNLVSTIPAPVFWKLYYKRNEIELKSKAVTFVLCDKEPDHVAGQKYDMIYFVDELQKYTRISKKPGTRNETMILYEFTGAINKEEVITYLPKDCNVVSHYIDPAGIIYSNKNNIPPKNVLFVGRFANWLHSDKQQDVIKEALFDFDFRDIWNRQANFTKLHIDFNRLKNDLEYREKLTKDYILLLVKEGTEVLDEINYKPHAQKKKVYVDKIHVELIDIQKFLFNLMMIWGMTPDKFIETFHSKSDIVEKRYEESMTP